MGFPLEIKMEPRMCMDTLQSNGKSLSPNDSRVKEDLIGEHRNLLSRKEDLQVDIMECANSSDDLELEEEAAHQDVSNSSSFDDLVCASDGSGFGGEEAESKLCDGTEFFSVRKRKLTDEWRRFIRPIMWRCKWLELKVKEFQSQARKYDKEMAKHYQTKQKEIAEYYQTKQKEMAEYYQTKKCELDKSKLEGYELDAKSLPYPFHSQRVKVLKRRKRKRVDDTTDVGSYVSNHSLFSYTKNRTPLSVSAHYHDLGCRSMKAGDEIDEDYPVPELEFSDNLLTGILRKIDEARSKTQRLKRRVDELMCRYSLEEILTDHNPDSTEENECVPPQSAHTEDLLIPETEAVSQREVMIQNSGQPLIRITLGDVMEETEMDDDEAAKQEQLDYFEKVINEVTVKPRLQSEELEEPEESNADTSLATIFAGITTRKRKKRPPSWMSTTTSARRRSVARRRKTSR